MLIKISLIHRIWFCMSKNKYARWLTVSKTKQNKFEFSKLCIIYIWCFQLIAVFIVVFVCFVLKKMYVQLEKKSLFKDIQRQTKYQYLCYQSQMKSSHLEWFVQIFKQILVCMDSRLSRNAGQTSSNVLSLSNWFLSKLQSWVMCSSASSSSIGVWPRCLASDGTNREVAFEPLKPS